MIYARNGGFFCEKCPNPIWTQWTKLCRLSIGRIRRRELAGIAARSGQQDGTIPAYDAGVIDEKALDNIQHKEQT
jgi:hypothetical protein